jgi:uncharacterized membrane protein
MIRDPFAIIAVLLAIEGAVLYAAEMPRLSRLFRIIPFMFWIYLLPMVACTAGVFEIHRDELGQIVSPVQNGVIAYCLPGSLILLLLNVDLRAIARLGTVALVVMAAGALGVMIGGPVVAVIFKPWLPANLQPDMWAGIGALSASWTGGSSNLVAVASGVQAPKGIVGPIMVVDTIVGYGWMGMLMFLAGKQDRFDRWNRSRMGVLEELRRRTAADGPRTPHPITLGSITLMLVIAICGTAVARWLGSMLPQVERLINAGTWSILIASTAGLVLSLTPVRRLERFGASAVGYAMLYFVLAAIGSTTDLADMAGAPVLVLAGLVWVLIHGGFILLAGRLLRVPMALIAPASQANIGGVASAPVVAEVYQDGLAPVGLLLAVLGNVSGTYLGLTCAAVCKMVAGS